MHKLTLPYTLIKISVNVSTIPGAPWRPVRFGRTFPPPDFTEFFSTNGYPPMILFAALSSPVYFEPISGESGTGLQCRRPAGPTYLGTISFPIFVLHGPLGQLLYKKVIASNFMWGAYASPPGRCRTDGCLVPNR